MKLGETRNTIYRRYKAIGCRNSNYLAPRMYNIIPIEILDARNLKIFNKSVKKWLLDKKRVNTTHNRLMSVCTKLVKEFLIH